MNNISYLVPLLFIVIIVFLTALFIILTKTIYYSEHKENFMFRNYFPHEIYYQRNLHAISYFRLVLVLLFALVIASVIIFMTSFVGNISNLAFAIALCLFFILSSIVSLMLFLIRPNYLTQFKIYSILVFVFNTMSSGILGILSFNSIYRGFAHKIVGGFAFTLVAINIVLMLNPKLKDWDKLDMNKNSDGTVSYVRPKISPLAFSLWLSFLTLIIATILMNISLMLTTLNI